LVIAGEIESEIATRDAASDFVSAVPNGGDVVTAFVLVWKSASEASHIVVLSLIDEQLNETGD